MTVRFTWFSPRGEKWERRRSLHPSEHPRHLFYVVLAVGPQQIPHPGIVGASAGAKIKHRLGEVIDALSRQARLRTGADVAGLMTADASGGSGHRGEMVGVGGARARLLQIGPGLSREIGSERQYVLARHVLDERRLLIVLARALLHVAQLDVDVALVLTEDVRDRLVDRYARLAVAGRADRGPLRDRVGRNGLQPEGEERADETPARNSDHHEGRLIAGATPLR